MIVDIWMNMLMKSLFAIQANGAMSALVTIKSPCWVGDVFTPCSLWYIRYVPKPSFLTVTSLNRMWGYQILWQP